MCPHDNTDEVPVERLKEFLGPNDHKHDSFIIQLYEQRLEQDRNLIEIIDVIQEYVYKIVLSSFRLDGHKPGDPVSKNKSDSKSDANKVVPAQFIPLILQYLI